MTVAITRFSTPGSSGNQDVTTTDLGGLTPEAVLFIGSRGDSDGVARNEGLIGVGAATSSTNRWCCSSVSQDNVADTNDKRRARSDRCLLLIGTGGSASVAADFVQFITNGCRINYANAPSSGRLITAIFFAGVDAYAGRFSPGTTVDGTIDITAPGFQPDLVLLATHGEQFDDTTYDNHRISVGVAIDDDSDTQRCVMHREDDNLAAGAPEARLTTNRGIYINNTGSDWACQLSTFDSQGFSNTLRLASAGSAEVGYLALRLGTRLSLAVHDSPTSTGNQSSTDPGFQPNFLLMIQSLLESNNSTATDATAGSFAVSGVDSDEAYSSSISLEDAADPTDVQALVDSKPVHLPEGDGTAGLEASFVSFDVTGWTLNYSAVLANAKKSVVLAIGPDSEKVPGPAMIVRGPEPQVPQLRI